MNLFEMNGFDHFFFSLYQQVAGSVIGIFLITE